MKAMARLILLGSLLVLSPAAVVSGVEGQGVASPDELERDLAGLAKAGDANAQFRLAQMYFTRALAQRSQAYGDEMVSLLEEAVAQENGDAETLLGYLNMSGLFVVKNRSKAVYLWQRAARKGVAQAQFNLGVFYASKHTRADDRVAMEWYRRAYRGGMMIAAQNMDYMARQGRGLTLQGDAEVASADEQGYSPGFDFAASRR